MLVSEGLGAQFIFLCVFLSFLSMLCFDIVSLYIPSLTVPLRKDLAGLGHLFQTIPQVRSGAADSVAGVVVATPHSR